MGQFCGHKMHTCNHCQKNFFSKQSLTRHIMNITCKEIHNHINHLISINTPDDMIIESLKEKFQLKDFNFMEIQHRLNLLKHEYAKKKIIVRNYVENAFVNNDFNDRHKEVIKHIYNNIYNPEITSKEFANQIKIENDFVKFYSSFLEMIKNDHGEPTTRAYTIADDFVVDRIANSVTEENTHSKSSSKRKRSREDEDTHIRRFQVSNSSSSSHVQPIPIHASTELTIPTVLSVPDTIELQRNESVTSDDNVDVWTNLVKFFDKFI